MSKTVELPLVYPAHGMEGLKIPEESVLRPEEIEKELKGICLVWKPEDHQVEKDKQQLVDLKALWKSDILIADHYARGLVRNGKTVFAYGTAQEVGFTKGLNFILTNFPIVQKITGKKPMPIYQIIRQRVEDKLHPFDVEGLPKEAGVTKNFNNLKSCCEYVRKHHAT